MYTGFGTAAVMAIKLPSCYSAELHECLQADEPTSYPGCTAMFNAFDANYDASDAAVEALPYCSERDRYYWGGAGVLMGILVGSVAATLMV